MPKAGIVGVIGKNLERSDNPFFEGDSPGAFLKVGASGGKSPFDSEAESCFGGFVCSESFCNCTLVRLSFSELGTSEPAGKAKIFLILSYWSDASVFWLAQTDDANETGHRAF